MCVKAGVKIPALTMFIKILFRWRRWNELTDWSNQPTAPAIDLFGNFNENYL
jgi:hypothetical protein